MKLRVGILGLGRAGRDLHLKPLSTHPEYEVRAIFDQNSDKISGAQNLTRAESVSSVDQLLSRPDIDVVVIATPTSSHFKLTLQALRSGKHVVLEKPMTPTHQEATELLRVSQETNKKIVVHFNFRFSNDFLHVKRVIASKVLGQVHSIKKNVSYLNRRSDWQSSKREFGGILNAVTIHSVDQILSLTKNDPTELWVDLRKLLTLGDASDHSKILLRFEDGWTADIECSWVESLNEPLWAVHGTHGSLIVSDGVARLRHYDEAKIKPITPDPYSYLSAESIQWEVSETRIEPGFSSDFYDLLVNHLTKDGISPVPFLSALRTSQLMEKLSAYSRPFH